MDAQYLTYIYIVAGLIGAWGFVTIVMAVAKALNTRSLVIDARVGERSLSMYIPISPAVDTSNYGDFELQLMRNLGVSVLHATESDTNAKSFFNLNDMEDS